MRKINNHRSSKEKSQDRKFKKVCSFVDKCSSVCTVLQVFKEHMAKHKRAWEESIKYDDGYLKPYYKGLLTQTINRCNEVLDYFKVNGFIAKANAMEEVEEIIKRELRDNVQFENDESEYTKEILLSGLTSLFCTVSFKKFHRDYNKVKGLEPKLQEIIDVANAYFEFFERDVQSFEALRV